MLTRLTPRVRVKKTHVSTEVLGRCSVHIRGILTLAIETSCDDTSVAVLETFDIAGKDQSRAKLLYHETVTAKNEIYRGIHPFVALASHHAQLGSLVEKAINHLPSSGTDELLPSGANGLFASHYGFLRRKPDFVCATRGPGMRANLAIGLATGKGLAIAWGVPLLGVHHMQAHALTPRLVHAMEARSPTSTAPSFPFLTLLVSGGHTLLVSSTSLTDHEILAATADIALGDCLDKAARAILPSDKLRSPYGRALEEFAFQDGQSYDYEPIKNRAEEMEPRPSAWDWTFTAPLGQSRGGLEMRSAQYSFSGLLSAVERACGVQTHPGKPPRSPEDITVEERREMAREVQRVAFEHLCGRAMLHLHSLDQSQRRDVRSVVVSGGVAANKFLRLVLRSMLDAQGFEHVETTFPPIEYCTDNAAMIAWAGTEMYRDGWRSTLDIEPIRRWSLDPRADDGGILGVGGWKRARV